MRHRAPPSPRWPALATWWLVFLSVVSLSWTADAVASPVRELPTLLYSSKYQSLHSLETQESSPCVPETRIRGSEFRGGDSRQENRRLKLELIGLFEFAYGRKASDALELSRDPIGFDGGWNLYGFVDNNPLGARDPEGLGPVEMSAWGDYQATHPVGTYEDFVASRGRIPTGAPRAPVPTWLKAAAGTAGFVATFPESLLLGPLLMLADAQLSQPGTLVASELERVIASAAADLLSDGNCLGVEAGFSPEILALLAQLRGLNLPASGLYRFKDAQTGNLFKYLGQSGDLYERLAHWIKKGRLTDLSSLEVRAVKTYGAVGRTASRVRRYFEQRWIDQSRGIGGGILSNTINSVDADRMGSFQALQRWLRGGKKGPNPLPE